MVDNLTALNALEAIWLELDVKQEPTITSCLITDKQLEEKKDKLETIGEKAIRDLKEKLNAYLEPFNTRCEYSIHEQTKQIMIKIIDVETEETVKEIPPEQIVDMVAAMCEQAGLFVDKKL